MNFIKMLQVRFANKKKAEMFYQSQRKECCESCKYCYEYDCVMGYTEYKCRLKDNDFHSTEIFRHKCVYYEPCRGYKKYLNNIK